jgi:5-(carboxyamino)imidazole ribonucleotide mutase
MKKINTAKIAVIMGSKSDKETMVESCVMLEKFNIPHSLQIVSAHRTPNKMYEFAKKAKENGIRVIIAGAGGAAHLPGMVAALTTLPVLGVPVESKSLKGVDSLLSIVQMPAGVPVSTFAIGKAGAKNAALAAISILAISDTSIEKKLIEFRQENNQ